ncbi:alpha/beta-hydrolase [Acephala macrosclerotiorum]|nr:alpha/beta-hydrolase [Acephala macrosclerotiorum]
MTTHQTAKTQFIKPKDITFAYRRFGNASTNKTPLLFLIHFRGTMDFWDPLLINSIAAKRPVILFDNAGVGQSSGSVDDTFPKMAAHVLDFLSALEIKKVDILGFSMGGHVAPLVYLNAARAWWGRIHERKKSASGEERTELVSTGYADGAVGMMSMINGLETFDKPENRAEGSYDRLGDIKIPVFIGQGKDDYMIPTVNSFVMQQKLPNGTLKVFPDRDMVHDGHCDGRLPLGNGEMMRSIVCTVKDL